ncbi:MAG: hypothetical protein IPH93_17115 [Saprospiraceae bacterium]|nr:hypothetical protein [Saprospiraceae bacterium]
MKIWKCGNVEMWKYENAIRKFENVEMKELLQNHDAIGVISKLGWANLNMVPMKSD